VPEDREWKEAGQTDDAEDVEAHGNIPSNTPASAEPAATEEGPDVEGHLHGPPNVEP
jgi:hypothetical protein